MTSQMQRRIKVSRHGLQNSKPQEATLQNFTLQQWLLPLPGRFSWQLSMAWPQGRNMVCRAVNSNHGSNVSLLCIPKQINICIPIVFSNSEHNLIFFKCIILVMLLDDRNNICVLLHSSNILYNAKPRIVYAPGCPLSYQNKSDIILVFQ